MEEVAQLGGIAYDIAVQGNYTYIAFPDRLLVVSTTNPTAPGVVAELQLHSAVEEIGIYGDFLFISVSDVYEQSTLGDGLYVIDIQNPSYPTIATFHPMESPYTFTIAGNYLYLTQAGDIIIYNISNPLAIQSQGLYPLGEPVRDMLVEGNRLYINTYTEGLFTFDVANPNTLTLLGQFDPCISSSCYRNGVEVVGNVLYYSAQPGLFVLDMTNPSTPVQIARLTGSPYYNLHSLHFHNNSLYGTQRSEGLYVMDASQPATLPIIGEYHDTMTIFDMVAANGILQTADIHNGLRLFSVSNPTTPAPLGLYPTWARAAMSKPIIAGDYVYVATDADIKTLSLTDPSHPQVVNSTPKAGDHFPDWERNGNYIYYTDFQGIRALDIHSPANPVSLMITENGEYNCYGALATEGNRLFSYCYHGPSEEWGIVEIDISNPTAGTFVTMVSGSPGELQIVGSFLYALQFDPTLGRNQIVQYNINGGFTPTGVRFGEGPNTFTISDGLAFTTGYSEGVKIWDISNPATPQLITTFDMETSPSDTYAADGYLYVADSYGTQVLDIRTPTAPRLVAMGNQSTFDLVYAGDYIYSTAGNHGLVVEYFVPPASATFGALAGGTLNSSADGVGYTFPAGSFSQTVTVTHSLRDPGNMPFPPGLRPVNRYWDIGAIQSDGLPARLNTTYTVTIPYNEADLHFVDESTLALYRWQDNGWVVESSSEVDNTANTVSATPNALGRFALLGESTLTRRVYAPLSQR